LHEKSDPAPDLYDARATDAFLSLAGDLLRQASPVTVMEVCGTHTWAISRFGFAGRLGPVVKFISGPGCPVCVTDEQDLTWAIHAAHAGVVLHVPGDMLRVPTGNGSLSEARSRGGDVRVVYSPSDSVKAAKEEPDRQHAYFGVGFETTAPAIALALERAVDSGLSNFSIYSALKTMPAVLRTILDQPESRIDGFLLPGHVSTITGARAFDFMKAYGVPAVIAGFTPVEIAYAVYTLVSCILERRPGVLNCYTRLVSEDGNELAQQHMAACFERRDAAWRGFGIVPGSGLAIRTRFAAYDAARKHAVIARAVQATEGCMCASVVMGRISPGECPLFSRRCTPKTPVGPCMVSGEGACAAYYAFDRR